MYFVRRSVVCGSTVDPPCGPDKVTERDYQDGAQVAVAFFNLRHQADYLLELGFCGLPVVVLHSGIACPITRPAKQPKNRKTAKETHP